MSTNDVIALAKDSFKRYFSEYYQLNKNVQSVSYHNIQNNKSFSAVIEYKKFTQYVNFYKSILHTNNTAVINTCFEFDNFGKKAIFHFDTILDYLDSDDISFYTFPHCATNSAICSKLDIIMSATEKYYDIIVEIANNNEKLSDICNNFSCFNDLSYAFDYDFMTYYKQFYNINELYLMLKSKQGINGLTNPFEKRVYRVLDNMNIAQRKKLERNQKTQESYAVLDKIYMYVPQILIILLSVVGSVLLGIYLDKNVINPEWIGKEYGYTGLVFGIFGVVIGVILLLINIDKPLYKIIVPKNHYEEFMQILNVEEAPKGQIGFVCLLGIIVAVIMSINFAFTGVAVTKNYEIVKRDLCFSSVSHYPMESTEIAIIKGYYDNSGYYEYIEPAYAFKLNDEWYDFGVANNEAKHIIEDAIEKYNKEVNVYKSIDHIK